MPLLFLLPLLAQAIDPAGPRVPGGSAPALGLPLIDLPMRTTQRRVAAPPAMPVRSRLSDCLDQADSDPDTAIDTAGAWLKASSGTARTEPQQCLGSAYAAQQEWNEAETAFAAGRDAAGPDQHRTRASLGAMAGNAALAGNAPGAALAAFDTAHGDAFAARDTMMAGDIAMDRARALVALHREGEAASALTEARAADPANPLAWLLSATLARRQGHLAEAQADIETAGRLAPTDGEIGLEAGVIAMLAGHDEAARKDWASVLTAAPGSDAATAARGYLAQIAPPANH